MFRIIRKRIGPPTRRAMFFTFNVVEDGEHYEDYYALKRADFGNPKFHVATPTNFDEAGVD